MTNYRNIKKATKEEHAIMLQIAKRATQLAEDNDARLEPKAGLHILMDIKAVHCNIIPLRLKDLLEADSSNFVHDVFGIRSHLNRDTIELERCFIPRFAAAA